MEEGGAASASYVQLYLTALGADPQQVGILNSLGKLANAIVGLPLGWISDRFSLKKVVVFGFVLSVFSQMAFALSTSWSQAMPAMMLDAVATTLVGMFVGVFFITSIKQAADRATAMSMKSTLTSLLALGVPFISTVIVLNFGGINVGGIRPLFVIEMFVLVLVAVYALLKLEEVSFLQKKDTKKKSIWKDYKELAKIRSVQKWVITKGIRSFFGNSLLPFYSIFYVTVKGADPIVIGAMGTIGTLGALTLLIPFGRLADKFGRKKVIYITRPFSYISTIMVILAPTPNYLILAALLGSIQTVSNLMEITMEWELVSHDKRGRLAGLESFLWNLISIPGPILAGYLWNIMNPAYLLLLPILADIPFIVVLPTISETLSIVYDEKADS